MRARFAVLIYALIAYTGFLATTVWAIAFLAGRKMPTAIDTAHPGSWGAAVAIDLAVLGAFGVQHSVMARRSVKQRLARVMPRSMERSTYVLAADLMLALVLWQWRALPHQLWHIHAAPARAVVWTIYAIGWATAIGSTYMIDHFDLVGLRQAAAHGKELSPEQAATFKERWLYAWVRHPLMLGLLIAFWAAPTMTVGHLVFAAASTGYIAVGVQFEERDLRRELGATYDDYARRVPSVVPRPRRRASEEPASAIT